MRQLESFLLTIALVLPVRAEIVTDGSLGTVQALEGPDFSIDAQLGQQVGNNLFHSFETFNLATGERATFHGFETTKQVISRVTGGNPSHINGLLASDMPQADIYFINPAGILFGENARLDIHGSFYVSTADYLKLGETGYFPAKHLENTILTVAPPSAFGFLDAPVAPITIDKSHLRLPLRIMDLQSHTLALIGGDITIYDETLQQEETKGEAATLLASAGEIDLVSVASAGEVFLDPLHLAEETFTQLGTIQIIDTSSLEASYVRGANLDTTGTHGGKINIHADTLLLDNAYIFADTIGDKNGQGISIQVRGDVILKNTARITADVYKWPTFFPSEAIGDAADISISAENIRLQTGSQITSQSLKFGIREAKGNGGNITLVARDQIQISGYSQFFGDNAAEKFVENQLNSGVLTNTVTTGQGGTITISANKLRMDDMGEITAGTSGLGNAGNVSLQVGTLALNSGAKIDLNTGQTDKNPPMQTGDGGQLTIRANEAIFITGKKDKTLSGLFSNTFSTGQGGTITLSSPQLTIENAGTIQAGTTENGGKAGDIIITADHLQLREARIATRTEGNYAGGTVSITAKNFELETGEVFAGTIGPGNAGSVLLQVDTLQLKQGSQIAVTTSYDGKDAPTDTGHAGQLTIRANEAISITGKKGKKQSGLFSNTFSTGQGGTITLSSPQLTIENAGTIQASTAKNGGKAGDIIITTAQLQIRDAKLTTQSLGEGQGGTIAINASNIRMGQQGIITAQSQAGGDAGDIKINTKNMYLDQAGITTKAENAGGGNILLSGGQFLYFSDSQIEAKTQGLDKTAEGGNIDFRETDMFILDNSLLDASAIGGAGGNIVIIANHFIKSADSVLNISSQLNVDGEVNIEGAEQEVMDNFMLLPAMLLDASNLLKDPCIPSAFGQPTNRFTATPYFNSPTTPEDLQASLLPQ